MSPRRQIGPRALSSGLARGAIALAASGLLAVGCGGDDDDTDVGAGEIELLESGSGERIQLPAAYKPGQAADSDFSLTQNISGGGIDADINVDLSMSSEVADATEGEATVEQTVENFVIDLGDIGATSPELDELEDLKGAVLATTYDASGRQVGAIERVDGGPLPSGFEDFQGTSADLVFPDEPIGVGARWASGNEFEVEGGPAITTETIYELTELTDDGYTLEVSGSSPFDVEVDKVELSGEVRESGEIRGDRSNPLISDMTYDVNMEADAEGDSFTTSVSAELQSSDGAEAQGLGALTPSQQDVFEMVTSGASDDEVAQALELQPETVRAQLDQIYGTLKVSSRAELVAKYGG
jgi:DNA-binding CsgD family transcriptional regulator